MPGQRTPAVVRKTCAQAAIAKRPCLISISCQRRYLSGIEVMRPSGSQTPSGFVVPMSPGRMAVIATFDVVSDGAIMPGVLNAWEPIIIIAAAIVAAGRERWRYGSGAARRALAEYFQR